MNLDFEQAVTEIEAKIAGLKGTEGKPDEAAAREIAKLEQALPEQLAQIYANLTPWQTVQVARHPERPILRDYIAGMFGDFVELHGDRRFGDDRAIIGGFAMLDRQRVVLIGHQKGRTVEENLQCNFGMGRPEGYRKALRLMRLAEKYGLPVVCFIDTPGAYPGADAEERGQAEAIARNLTQMAILRAPIAVVVTGEGGSGGALGIGVGDVILMLSHAIYSVISPEGCASILWRDGSKAPEAANALKLTARSLLDLRVIDEIIAEPVGGAHRDPEVTMKAVKKALLKHLRILLHTSMHKLLKRRFLKYASMGRIR